MSSHTIISNKRSNKKFSCHSVDKRIIFHSKKYYNLNVIYKKLLENIKEICFSANCHYLFFFLFCIPVAIICIYFYNLDMFVYSRVLSASRYVYME